MSWFTNALTSTIGRKLLMALTGLFLILFLVVHVAGNLQLLNGDGGEAYNIYTKMMSTNPLIQTVSKLNFLFIITHVVVSILLTKKNRSARPVKYAYNRPSKNSTWSSRNMGILGFITLIFIVIHLKTFWFEMNFGEMPVKVYNGEEVKDMYTVVVAAFSQTWYAALYVVCMGFLAFHLVHGFQSAFQTLGLNHVKYNSLIKTLGVAFAIIVPVLFAIQPIYIYFQNM
ncbi:succinate dehydrogenase cytochrome b subunit [Rapidithrix thailandica]|uniref:Succinate dehydrogenase cytochrome b subunit n=1 Tax=Rapidithrix thailandica TaxID=413964 RepID=A0AAW9S8W4_9BACT